MNNEIDEIRKAANIVDIISSYVSLTQKGKNYFGVCPFHQDHSPSMSVSEEKQIYKCFSCGASGNVFTFISEYENVSFLEAVKIVAEKVGLSFHGKQAPKKFEVNKKEYEIMELALKFYQNNLNTKNGLKAREYLEQRKLGVDAQKDFDIGLALNKDYSLNKLLLSKNYDLETLVNLGLVNRNGEYLNDVFNNRVMFPIHDLDGKVVGFTGRIYVASEQAKYINSKESAIFKKGQILFNYHRAKGEIKKLKEVVIVEGNMDAIRMYSEGIKNVVALMGTSLTDTQVNLLKNMRAKIILMLDNDEAGETATINNGDILLKAGINSYVVRLSGEKDPDEYIIKNGKEAIINNIKKAMTFLDFKLKYYKKNKDLTQTNDLVSYIKEVTTSLKNVTDELTRNLTLKKISDDYNIPLDLLKRELAKVIIPKKVIPDVTPKEKTNHSKYDIICQNILYFMMNDKLYVDMFKKELGYLSIKKYRSLVNEIIYYTDTHDKIDEVGFLSFAQQNDVILDDVMEIIKNNNNVELQMEDFREYLKSALMEEKKAKIKNLKEAINNELDEDKKVKLASELVELKKGCVGNE